MTSNSQLEHPNEKGNERLQNFVHAIATKRKPKENVQNQDLNSLLTANGRPMSASKPQPVNDVLLKP